MWYKWVISLISTATVQGFIFIIFIVFKKIAVVTVIDQNWFSVFSAYAVNRKRKNGQSNTDYNTV